ncbi:ABC transporter ATP-binding protein [Oceanotoga sp. DSM 15011]|jgi:peptide/nickel transport system ATP-binding protein|uniref:ABC transporter ATP-binding protein n=2 Tax=unclassified Oceanotoga TaxID=2618448 RepID=UPI0021F401FA|nr:ABC transporter ATP-binding protein [Oceanotoga sp. DSM 15011]UYO98930.1 ABC transporter ATP-binding protein [Oceanotoga sp. DSM 15011]
MNDIVQVENLNKVFKIGKLSKMKTVHAINNISFEIKNNEILALVGESGSGKTTVARILSRLYKRTSGSIKVFNKEIPMKMSKTDELEYRKNVQLIFQDPFSSLNPLHSIYYILSRPYKIHNLCPNNKIRENIINILNTVGLSDEYLDKLPHELSGGQRQRIGIARALSVNPKLILADEPTSMLDVSIRLDIMNLMMKIRDDFNVSYLFITHDLAGAHYIADRIAIMYAGDILEIGNSSDIINNPFHPYTKLLKSAAPKPESGLKPERIDTKGEIPDLTDLPSGCSFHPRCPFASDLCRSSSPSFHHFEHRSVKCHLFNNGGVK